MEHISPFIRSGNEVSKIQNYIYTVALLRYKNCFVSGKMLGRICTNGIGLLSARITSKAMLRSTDFRIKIVKPLHQSWTIYSLVSIMLKSILGSSLNRLVCQGTVKTKLSNLHFIFHHQRSFYYLIFQVL